MNLISFIKNQKENKSHPEENTSNRSTQSLHHSTSYFTIKFREIISNLPRQSSNKKINVKKNSDPQEKRKLQTPFFPEILSAPIRLSLPSLQTQAFDRLEFKDLLCSNSLKLEDVQFYMHSNQSILESKTFHDPKNADLQSPINPRGVDLLFRKLQETETNLPSVDSRVGGAYVNNYPRIYGSAQINCDAFHVEVHPDYAFSVVADGCNWGKRPREAAQRAVAAASAYINIALGYYSKQIKTASQIACCLIQSIAMAHESIVNEKQNVSDAGTTTINICFAFADHKGKKYLLLAGVGDCKAFIVFKNKDHLYKVVEGTSRRLSFDPKDPGGRLGPYDGDKLSDPDLRNLSLTCLPLPEQECVILNVTDGVYDNLTPEGLGIDPYEVSKKFSETTKWSDLENEERIELETSYQNGLLSRLINEADTTQDSSLNTICQCITQHCHKMTSLGRTYMEEHPQAKEPQDKKEYPGKMDHCTVAAFRI
jgi:Protein phosphatase 2C